MKLLIDTNIVLEIVLDQERAEEAKTLLATEETHELFISDFSLHSIGILLCRRKQHSIFQQILKDLVLEGGLTVLTISVHDLGEVCESAKRWNLDFDDAYQYAAAEKFNLTIVSFDADFDRTERGKKTPADVLQASA